MPTTQRRRGAPSGNLNALKHGFYTRRINKHDLSGVESTDLKSLVEEVALIRVFTRRLVEALPPDADFYDLAETLRILCLASTAITRTLSVHCAIAGARPDYAGDIEAAILQVNAELRGKIDRAAHPSPLFPDATLPIPSAPAASDLD